MRIELPEPAHDSNVSVERALLARRSIRTFKDEPLTLREVSQILWAAQGITNPHGYRTAPSAGALFPLELRLVAGKVRDLAPGIYRYIPQKHQLVQSMSGDRRDLLAEAALGQPMMAHAPITLAISAVYERTTRKYRQRGMRYIFMEAGHAAQNVHLQAIPLNLGTVVVGAFSDDMVHDSLGLDPDENPLYLMPIGK